MKGLKRSLLLADAPICSGADHECSIAILVTRDREERIRIISARKATKHEEKFYKKAN